MLRYCNESHEKLKNYIKLLTYIYIPVVFAVFVIIGYWFIVGCMYYSDRNLLATVLGVIGILITFILIATVSIIDYYLKPVRTRRYKVERCNIISIPDDISGFIHSVKTDNGNTVILFGNSDVEITNGMSIDVIVNKDNKRVFAIPSLPKNEKDIEEKEEDKTKKDAE